MSVYLEIAQLDNGDIVLREVEEEAGEPLVSIRFSDEVRDMLGSDLSGVGEAMIAAATEYLEGESVFDEADPGADDGLEDGSESGTTDSQPTIH